MTPAEMRFIDDYVREGYTVEPMGTYYRLFDLSIDARHIEDAGNRAAVRFARDSRGFPDGIELLKLVPKVAVGSIEGGERGRGVGMLASTAQPSDLDSQSSSAPKCVRCDDDPAVRNGFCLPCFMLIEQDIALDDVERPEIAGKIIYDNDVDPYGKDAA